MVRVKTELRRASEVTQIFVLLALATILSKCFDKSTSFILKMVSMFTLLLPESLVGVVEICFSRKHFDEQPYEILGESWAGSSAVTASESSCRDSHQSLRDSEFLLSGSQEAEMSDFTKAWKNSPHDFGCRKRQESREKGCNTCHICRDTRFEPCLKVRGGVGKEVLSSAFPCLGGSLLVTKKSGHPLKNLSLVTSCCLFSRFLLMRVPYRIIFLLNLYLCIAKYCHISNTSWLDSGVLCCFPLSP